MTCNECGASRVAFRGSTVTGMFHLTVLSHTSKCSMVELLNDAFRAMK